METNLFIETRGSLIKVFPKDILFLQAEGRYTKIITSETSYYICKHLKLFENDPVLSQFFRSHQSYLVNINRIIEVTPTELIVDQGVRVPLARRRRRGIIERMKLQEHKTQL